MTKKKTQNQPKALELIDGASKTSVIKKMAQQTGLSVSEIKGIVEGDEEKWLEHKGMKKKELDAFTLVKMASLLRAVTKKKINKAGLKELMTSYGILHDKCYPREGIGLAQQFNLGEGKSISVTMPEFFRPRKPREEKKSGVETIKNTQGEAKKRENSLETR